jgi:hypothetical protein
MTNGVSAYEVWVHGTDWPPTIINHLTASKAKYQYWLSVTDCYPSIAITAMRARKFGGPQTSDRLARVAKYRSFPAVAGSRVKSGDLTGTVVDGDSSCNFRVILDSDCPKWAGQIVSIHPQEMILID